MPMLIPRTRKPALKIKPPKTDGTPAARHRTPKADKPAETDAFTKICAAALHAECVKEYRFHPTRKWRFDYALPAFMIALEVEGGVWTGGRHTSAKGFLGDIEKYNKAALMGWRLFRVTPSELYKTATLNMLRVAIETDCKAAE